MRHLSVATFCVLLFAAAACGSSPGDSVDNDPEIRSQDDVQRFFEAVVPGLIEVLTQLADEQLPAASGLSSSSDKGGGSSSVPCSGGGTLSVDLTTGQATLTGCTVNGVTISATLVLSVERTGPSSYTAVFSGALAVSGTFEGTVEVVRAVIDWSDPATEENTSWGVTVLLNGEEMTFTSADPGGSSGACEWNRNGRADEVRVHVSNFSDTPGILVQLTVGGATCAIADEAGELQLPLYGTGDGLAGLGQALLVLDVGGQVSVAATHLGATADAVCTVSAEAYQSGNPDVTAGQAFLDVYPSFEPSIPPTVECGLGFEFEFSGGTTVIRFGGTCVPGDEGNFSCTSSCLDICLPAEIAQLWECGSDSICKCTCVIYNQ